MFILKKLILHSAMFYSRTQTTLWRVSNHSGLYDTYTRCNWGDTSPTSVTTASPPLSPQLLHKNAASQPDASVVHVFSRLAQAASVEQRAGWGHGPTQQRLYSGQSRLLWGQRLLRRPSHRATPTAQETLRTRQAVRCWHLYVFHTAADLFGSAFKIPARIFSHPYNELLFKNWPEGNCCSPNYSQQQHESQKLARGTVTHKTATVAREVPYILGWFLIVVVTHQNVLPCVLRGKWKVQFHFITLLSFQSSSHFQLWFPNLKRLLSSYTNMWQLHIHKIQSRLKDQPAAWLILTYRYWLNCAQRQTEICTTWVCVCEL